MAVDVFRRQMLSDCKFTGHVLDGSGCFQGTDGSWLQM